LFAPTCRGVAAIWAKSQRDHFRETARLHTGPRVSFRLAERSSWKPGNGLLEAATYDDPTGVALVIGASATATSTSPIQRCSDLGGTNVHCTDYLYDQFINLAQQSRHFYPVSGGVVQTSGSQVIASETYQYDELQRLLGESRGYTNLTPSSALSETYSYDDICNITSKSDFGGAYSYGNASRPSGAPSLPT